MKGCSAMLHMNKKTIIYSGPFNVYTLFMLYAIAHFLSVVRIDGYDRSYIHIHLHYIGSEDISLSFKAS